MATRGIYKRGDIYWIRYAGVDGDTIFETTKSKKKADAEKLLTRRKAEVLERRSPDKVINPVITFEDFTKKYEEFCGNQKGIVQKKRVIKQLNKYFGRYNMTDISMQIVEQYATSRRKINKNADSTVNRHLATIKNIFTKAEDWNYITPEQNETIHKIKMVKEENARLRFLSRDEIPKFLEACAKQPHLWEIAQYALNTGCRQSEILGLKWENVDLVHGLIRLNITKSGEGRDIPINDTLKPILQKRHDNNKKNIPYVFYDYRTNDRFGEIKRSFHTACDRAGIKNFRFHDMRHTFASHLVMSGVDLMTVKDLLGHKTLTMTVRYAHLAPNHKLSAINVLTDAYKPVKKEEKKEEPAKDDQPETPVDTGGV